MKFFLILFSLSIHYCFAQAFEYDWVRAGQGDKNNPGTSVITDHEGNVYVTGSFSGNYTQFDAYSLYNTGINSDIYLVKYDATGTVLWARAAGGHDDDIAYALTVDEDNNVYVTGRFSSSIMYFGTISINNVSDLNKSDVFLAKYDAQGNIMWAKAGNGISDWDSGTAVCTDPEGNVYLGGRFGSKTISFDTAVLSNYNQSNSSNFDDLFLVKYDSDGMLIWAKSAGGNGIDIVYSIASDKQGNVFLTGAFGSQDLVWGNTTLSALGGSDIFIAKYNTDGNVLWIRSAVGEEDDDYGLSIATDQDGNAFITGVSHSSTFYFNGIALNNTPGYTQMYIAKYNAFGTPLWAKGVSSPGSQYGAQLSIDANENIYIAGTFSYDSLIIGKFVLHGHGFDNGYMIIINKIGQILYATALGDSGRESCNGLALNAQGDVCITGAFVGDNVDFGSTTLNNTSQNESDMFLLKIKIDPELLTVIPRKFGFYPNPSGGIITGSFLQLDNYMLNVYSVLGKLVYQTSFHALEQDFNLSNLASGTYIFQLQNDSGVVTTEKIVINGLY